MKITVQELAALLNGEIEGDPTTIVTHPSRIEEGEPGSISFFGNPRYEGFVYTTQASALLVPKDFKPQQPISAVLIRVADVYRAVSSLMNAFGQVETYPDKVSETAILHESVQLDPGIFIGDFSTLLEGVAVGEGSVIRDQVFIGKNVRIGKGVLIYPGVRILRDCVIGDNCIIHPNAVIGSDGFGFAPNDSGGYDKIQQLGNVVIEDEVEIGANTCIDRASFGGSTLIRKGVKLDNLIHIAHNVEVGEHTVIAAQVGIAGSTRIGKYNQIGGQVGFAGHLTTADRTRIQAQSGIGSSIKEPGKDLFGYPAIDYRAFIRSHYVFKQLPELEKQVRKLEKQLAELQATLMNKTDEK